MKSRKKSARGAAASVPAEPATIESVLDDSIATLSLGIAAIRTEIKAITGGTAKSSKHDDASRIAFLTGKVGSIADSVRKVEAARAKRLDDITPAIVLAYLRQLDASDRGRLLREAAALDSKGSGLA